MFETDQQYFEETMKFKQHSETTEAVYLSYEETMTHNIDDILATLVVDGSVNNVDATEEEDTPLVVVLLEVRFSDQGVGDVTRSFVPQLVEEEFISCTVVTNDQTTSTTVQLTVTNVVQIVSQIPTKVIRILSCPESKICGPITV